MLEHRSPFDFGEKESVHAGQALERSGQLLTPVSGRGLLLLQSASAPALEAALGDLLTLRLPAPQTSGMLGDYALLWLSPAEWLLELPQEKTDSIRNALAGRLEFSLAAVTDFTDALISFDLSGARAEEILMSGCSLDLSPRAFPRGQVARTVLADVPVILWKTRDPSSFRCLSDRGFCAHLLTWLAGATPP